MEHGENGLEMEAWMEDLCAELRRQELTRQWLLEWRQQAELDVEWMATSVWRQQLSVQEEQKPELPEIVAVTSKIECGHSVELCCGPFGCGVQ